MTELNTLAREARRSLAEASEATLLIEGLGRIEDDDCAVLHDRDGVPAFLCPAGSPVAAAAAHASSAVLSVPSPDGAYEVIFAGTLSVTGAVTVEGGRVDVVELLLTSVSVESAETSGHGVSHDVPLEAYTGFDPVVSAAAAIRCHTNARHGAELREFVSARYGLAPREVAGASLLALDSESVEIGWVDVDGARSERFGFARSARTPIELAATLRCRLARPFDEWPGQ